LYSSEITRGKMSISTMRVEACWQCQSKISRYLLQSEADTETSLSVYCLSPDVSRIVRRPLAKCMSAYFVSSDAQCQLTRKNKTKHVSQTPFYVFNERHSTLLHVSFKKGSSIGNSYIIFKPRQFMVLLLYTFVRSY